MRVFCAKSAELIEEKRVELLTGAKKRERVRKKIKIRGIGLGKGTDGEGENRRHPDLVGTGSRRSQAGDVASKSHQTVAQELRIVK